jgi:peroxiredoxin
MPDFFGCGSFFCKRRRVSVFTNILMAIVPDEDCWSRQHVMTELRHYNDAYSKLGSYKRGNTLRPLFPNFATARGTMLRIAFCLSLFAALLAVPLDQLSAAEPPPPVGTRVGDFTLPEPATSKDWSLGEKARNAKVVVLVFTSTSCPVCISYAPRLGELVKRHASDQVVWAAVCSHASDDPATITKYAREAEYPIALLKDDGTTLADKLHVDRVPSVLVLDGARTVRYTGRIDDQFSPTVKKAKASTSELADAISAVLKGEAVATASVPAAGCKLTRSKETAPATDPVTYHKHVAAILQAKCQECHRPGEAGPFALQSYQQAKNWSAMMREVVADDVMPPWHATAPYGHFKNDRRLTADEKKTLLAWIDQGCVEGNAKDAPPARTFTEGWRLGREPDEVLRMKKPVKVPAHGNYPYQYITLGDPFPEDRWVTAVEVRPEQRAVVHHIIAFVLPPKTPPFELAGSGFAKYMLGAYVPGDQPIIAAPGQAKKITKGSQILLEMHYTPNGRAVEDRSTIGLCYAKKAPDVELHSLAVMNDKFRIPPGAANHEVKSTFTFDKPTTIESLTPHMHVRGKSFKYELVSKDGKRETVLDVPKYDFNWQSSYYFATPLQLPAGSTLECTAFFDNSAKNPFNPDPMKTIRWGNMTADEMMIGFVMYHTTK